MLREAKAVTTTPRLLRSDDPIAAEFVAAIKAGDAEHLGKMLRDDPALATCTVEGPGLDGRSPLHLFADAPGHLPNPAAIVRVLVAAGADLNAPALGMWHREAPLHWAASNDDVALVDALLDSGADIERVGSSINGRSPLSSAVGYGQWQVARRLAARGAHLETWHAAALGLLPNVVERMETAPPSASEEISSWFWNACHGGHLEVAQYLLEHGADFNWRAPWSGQTPLDIAHRGKHGDVIAWLAVQGAHAAGAS